MDDGQEAIPLMAQEEYTHEFNGGRNASALKDPERPPVKSPWSSSSILLLLACLVTLISLLFNTFTFSKSWYPFMGASPSYKLDVGKLRRPSLYLGLERVPEINARNGNIHKYLSVPSSSAPSSSSPIGWPAAVARVSSAYPYFIFPQDGWVFLTEQDRAIVEFPAIPNLRSGQRCAFAAYLPQRRDLKDKLLTIERDDGVSPDPIVSFTPLSPSTVTLDRMTWMSRPPPSSTTDEPVILTAAFGGNQTTTSFLCPLTASGPSIFEVMCVGGGCRVEYDANAELVDVAPLLGIQLVTV